MFFSSNIKLLRRKKGLTQDAASDMLKLKRSTLSGYENNIAQPGLNTLLDFSRFYNISVDTLLRSDLHTLTQSQMKEIEKGVDMLLKGGNFRVLATTVDENNNENIELVNEKAKAGYASGFADTEYIGNLPRFQLPFLSGSKKYRAFQVSGDSMLPITDGSWVTGEYVPDWSQVKSDRAYIILTMQEGIVFKMAENNFSNNGTLNLYSLNSAYKPFTVHVSEIKEIWKFVNYIATEIPQPAQFSDLLTKTLENLRADVEMLKKKIG